MRRNEERRQRVKRQQRCRGRENRVTPIAFTRSLRHWSHPLTSGARENQGRAAPALPTGSRSSTVMSDASSPFSRLQASRPPRVTLYGIRQTTSASYVEDVRTPTYPASCILQGGALHRLPTGLGLQDLQDVGRAPFSRGRTQTHRYRRNDEERCMGLTHKCRHRLRLARILDQHTPRLLPSLVHQSPHSLRRSSAEVSPTSRASFACYLERWIILEGQQTQPDLNIPEVYPTS